MSHLQFATDSHYDGLPMSRILPVLRAASGALAVVFACAVSTFAQGRPALRKGGYGTGEDDRERAGRGTQDGQDAAHG